MKKSTLGYIVEALLFFPSIAIFCMRYYDLATYLLVLSQVIRIEADKHESRGN